jgi:hypothetical protein
VSAEQRQLQQQHCRDTRLVLAVRLAASATAWLEQDRCGSVQLQQLAAFSWRLQFNLQRQQKWRLDNSSASAAAAPALCHHLALAVAASALQHFQQHSAVRRCSITVISATAITATATAAPISVHVSCNSICAAALHSALQQQQQPAAPVFFSSDSYSRSALIAASVSSSGVSVCVLCGRRASVKARGRDNTATAAGESIQDPENLETEIVKISKLWLTVLKSCKQQVAASSNAMRQHSPSATAAEY